MSRSNHDDSVRNLPWLVWMVVVFGSISSAGFGFDQAWWASVLSSPQFIQNFGTVDPITHERVLSSYQQSLGTGLGYVGVIIGILCGSPMNERLGRKNTLWIQSAIVTAGIIIEATCKTSFAQFIVGKLIVYLGGGVATSSIPAYQAECAPKSLRGLMTGTYNAFLMLGGLAAALIVYLCRHISSDWAWRAVVVAQIAIPLASWISLPFMPESPYWLVARGRLDEAAASLCRLRGPSFPAEAEVEALQTHSRQQRERLASATWAVCFTDRVNRRRTLICIGTQIFQQAQGISFVANYQAVFLQQIGFKEVLLMAVVVYGVGVVANFISMATTDRLGRRTTLTCSALLLGALMLCIGGLTTTNGATNMSYAMQVASVVLLMLWFFSFQLTWGPLAWVLTAEVPPGAVREKVVALSGLGAYLTGLVIVFVNPYTQAEIGGRVAFIYGALSVLASGFAWVFVPEMRQRTLEEIDEMFRDGVPARLFKCHVCRRVPGGAGVLASTSKEEEGEELVENA
ncbi:general substrate transporter [Aspergillus germanicus]